MNKMENVKVVSIEDDEIVFDNGVRLFSDHSTDCCESHYLCTGDLKLEDFEGLEFNISNDNFFNRIDGYGIELVPIKGHSVKIPGYGFNNGYYSSALALVLSGDRMSRRYDISECQVING